MDINVNFFVADDFRQELAGKITAIGLYPNNTILLEIPKNVDEIALKEAIERNEPNNYVLDRISLMLNVSGDIGDYNFSSSLFSPDGKELGNGTVNGNIHLTENLSHNLIFQIAPLIFNQFGNYRCDLKINNKVFNFSFKLIKKIV